MLTVLFAHTGEDWIRGSERCLLDLVERLDRAAFRCHVWCDSTVLQREAVARGATASLFDRGALEAATTFWPHRALRGAALAEMQRVRPDVVHVNAHGLTKFLLPAAWRSRTPVIVHLHLIPTPSERYWGWLHQASVAVGPSRTAIEGLFADGMAEERLRVIYNGVDPSRITGPHRPGATAPRARLELVSVGSLIPRKGMDTLVRAVRLLDRRGVGLRLRIVGGGEQHDELARLAQREGVTETVEFLGERDDVGTILADADLFLSGARAEAFPLTLIEAAYAGLPIVASDIAPHRESIVDGVTGRLFPVDRHDVLADVIAELDGSRAELAAMGEAGHGRAAERFLVERYVEQFASLYRELQAGSRWRFGLPFAARWPRTYWAWLGGRAARPIRRLVSAS